MRKHPHHLIIVVIVASLALLEVEARRSQARDQTPEHKIGIIGCDTSHVTAFTKLLNDKSDPNHVPGARVVAAFKGGSPDVESSRARVDGRPHLNQVRPVFAAKKRVFIDKPFAASYADAREIVRLSRESGTPFFSSSSLRFADDLQAMKRDERLGAMLGAF